MAGFDKIVVVTKKTALEELIERFNTRDQARFYIEHLGASFQEYQDSHDTYQRALAMLKDALPDGLRSQFIERGFLPTFLFGEHDLVVTLGPDGLVVNTAKYLQSQPLLAVNPDPRRIDGVLVPVPLARAGASLRDAVRGRYALKRVSMARAQLSDGQTLYAVNDLFIGQRTHVSARYALALDGRRENQSSSGVIVSTGAGSTGWFRSVITGATEIAAQVAQVPDVEAAKSNYRFDWEADYLVYSVREPFESKTSSATLVFGRIPDGEHLEITSQMPQNGVIFSDGVEEDFLEFNSGVLARIGLADRRLHLIVPG